MPLLQPTASFFKYDPKFHYADFVTKFAEVVFVCNFHRNFPADFLRIILWTRFSTYRDGSKNHKLPVTSQFLLFATFMVRVCKTEVEVSIVEFGL